MSLLTVITDLTDCAYALNRIADALDRISPPPQPMQECDPPANTPADRDPGRDPTFNLAESPEQYHDRTDREAALAISLGVAPWSPDLQRVIFQMRGDILKQGLNDEQADQAIREAFQLAKAQANER